MPITGELLRSYGHLVQRLTEAEAWSLFLPEAPEIHERPRLVHGQGQRPVPELDNLSTAAEIIPGATLDPVASREPGGWLIPVSADLARSSSSPGHPPVEDRRRLGKAGERPILWIGLRLASGQSLPSSLAWQQALVHGAVAADHYRRTEAVLSDPVTELPGRADFQATLRREAALALEMGHQVALMLVNPDDFKRVNERFGSEAGDTVVREIAERLDGTLRRSDSVHRYGGVIFAILLTGVSRAQAMAVADKLNAALSESPYLGNDLRLEFSLGLATLDGSSSSSLDADHAAWHLFRRADRALTEARLAVGDEVPVRYLDSGEWALHDSGEWATHSDRLEGIFTANLGKDYRNMLLLWDTVEIMTTWASPVELAAKTVGRLAAAFEPERVGLFRWTESAEGPYLVAEHAPGQLILSAAERALVERARREQKMLEKRSDGDATPPRAMVDYALPLLARGECFGCLYLSGTIATLSLDPSDKKFVRVLADQLAAALDRAELAERERRAREWESQRLEVELEELRKAAEATHLVYGSEPMKALMSRIHRAAPTDATVLVTGPSGSGKELVARMVHALSQRHGEPPVVVDCGAISASLIDSELFGHERGAYTGATGRTLGRLAEAAGSTLILDEIGELPLEVQAKLLRFVQEKEIIPVGGARPRSVDARLVAVTNRDLEAEVRAGGFREDLYYRLKVLHFEVPPLAERPEDIPLLIDHFVTRFAARYQKRARSLTPEALELAQRHTWPGNVRELQNRLMQAVIMADRDEITPEELGLEMPDANPSTNPHRESPTRGTKEAGVDTMELNVDQLEKRHIERLLASEEGSVPRVAERLGMARSTLYQKMKRHGIKAPRRPRR